MDTDWQTVLIAKTLSLMIESCIKTTIIMEIYKYGI